MPLRVTPSLPLASDFATHRMPSYGELWFVGAFLVLVFVAQLLAAFHLNGLQAFDQYNLFFDADSNQYVSAVAHGWSFNRAVHPGFALLFNVPTRAFDVVISGAGLATPGAVRAIAPIMLPALCGLVGGIFWWRACCEVGWSALARTGGLILMQGSFSQVLFSSVPECYPVSGMLYCVLLWAAARAHREPMWLERHGVQWAWLLLAVISTGVTVTNGAVWLAVWLALRLRIAPWRRWLAEGTVGAVVVLVSIPSIAALDRLAYSLEPVPLASTARDVSGHGLRSAFVPDSLSARVVELPAHALASIVSPSADKIRNPLAEKNSNRYQFGFSFIESAVTPWRVVVSWVLMLTGLALTLPRLASSPLARACAAVFVFNAALHAAWGLELFLYSQHWLAFLVFAVAAALQRAGAYGAAALWAVGVGVAAHSVWRFSGMIAVLEMWPT